MCSMWFIIKQNTTLNRWTASKVDDPIILVGANESYEPRCRAHHIVAPSTSDEEEM